MQRSFTFSEGEYYHIYNRGVDRREIFANSDDKTRFQRMLYIANGTKPVVYKTVQRLPLDEIERGEQIVAIGAYVFMPNHFHILARETTDGGISKFMSKLTTGYSKYFNKRYERRGNLLERPFLAEHAGRDEYLKYLYAYIHLNPVKLIDPHWKEGGIKDADAARGYLEKYYFSSLADYLSPRSRPEEEMILSKSEFPDYFNEARDFKDYLNDWLEFEPAARLTKASN